MINKGFLCIQHGTRFAPGNYTYSKMYDKGHVYRSDSTSLKDRQIAYVVYCMDKKLYGGSYDGKTAHSTYQGAMWYLLNNYGGAKNNANVKAMINYKGTEPYSSGQAGITISNKLAMVSGVGTINVSSVTGTVSSVDVTLEDPNGNTITRTITSGSGDEYVKFYWDLSCTAEINIGNIKKGTVYLKNLKGESNYKVKSVKFNVKSSGSGYIVTLGIYTKGSGTKQQIVKPYITYGADKTTSTIISTVEETKGILKVKKQNEKGEPLEGVRFKLYCQENQKWVYSKIDGNVSGDEWDGITDTYSGDDKTFVDDISIASSYTTGKNGELTIENLYTGYTYYLVEMDIRKYNPSTGKTEIDINEYFDGTTTKIANAWSNLEGQNVEIQNGWLEDYKFNETSESRNYAAVKGVKVYKGTTNTITVIDDALAGEFVIKKVDADDTDRGLSGAKFIIKTDDNKWLAENKEGSYDYVENKSDATIYETGADVDNEEFEEGEVAEANNQVTIHNLKMGTYYIYEIQAPEGYDIKAQENYDKDNEWVYCGEVSLTEDNISDSNIEVVVKNQKKTPVNKIEGLVWLDTPRDKTNEINNIYDSGETLLNGITVYLKDANDNTIATTTTKNGGKYTFEYDENASNPNDNKYKKTYGELKNCHVVFIYNSEKYTLVAPFVGDNARSSKVIEKTGSTGGEAITCKPLTDFYNESNCTIENINMGLAEKHDPQYDINETLSYVKVIMNGYEYTYNYGNNEKFAKDGIVAPKVSRQNSTKTFTASVYPSDVAYNATHEGEPLQVYVVYKIDVTNSETRKTEDYTEIKLNLTSLENRFDTERYDLCTDASVAKKEVSAQIQNWSNGNNGARYGLGTANDAFSGGLSSQQTKSTYIQYKIKKDALKKMLEKELNYTDIENYPSITYVNGYHDYKRKHYYSVTDEEGNVTTHSYWANHTTSTKEMHSGEYYIMLNLNETPRKVSGMVFEDSFIDGEESNTNLGNGFYDENENKAKGVTVEIIDSPNKEANPIKLYQVESNGGIHYADTGDLPDAKTVTNDEGKYSFEGIVPGKYYIRFTYGDGSQKIYDTEGNEIDIYSEYYKSTIITNNEIRNAMETNTDATEDWYKKLDKNTYSTATDNLDERRGIIDYYDKGIEGDSVDPLETNIHAYTPKIGISIEKDTATSTNNGDDHKPYYEGFNLGIIKVPDVKTELYKEITNVTLSTQVGNAIVSENPTSNRSPYLSDLSNVTSELGGSHYAKLEIDPSYINGSKLEITYTLEVVNSSDINYNNDEYYKYGTSEENPSTVQVVVTDLLDKKFEENVQIKNGTISISKVDENEEYYTLEINDWTPISTGQSETIEYIATAQLSPSDDDTLFNNQAYITKLKLSDLGTLQKNYVWSKDSTMITVTPSTGADRTNTYWIVGAIALVVLATGIVILKKKVL